MPTAEQIRRVLEIRADRRRTRQELRGSNLHEPAVPTIELMDDHDMVAKQIEMAWDEHDYPEYPEGESNINVETYPSEEEEEPDSEPIMSDCEYRSLQRQARREMAQWVKIAFYSEESCRRAEREMRSRDCAGRKLQNHGDTRSENDLSTRRAEGRYWDNNRRDWRLCAPVDLDDDGRNPDINIGDNDFFQMECQEEWNSRISDAPAYTIGAPIFTADSQPSEPEYQYEDEPDYVDLQRLMTEPPAATEKPTSGAATPPPILRRSKQRSVPPLEHDYTDDYVGADGHPFRITSRP